MNERLAEALDHISDKHIAEAAGAKRRHRRTILRTVAAILVVVILFNLPYIPSRVNAKTISEASGTRAMARPDYDKYKDKNQFHEDLDAYLAHNDAQAAAARDAVSDLAAFFSDTTLLYMEGAKDNRVWSPINGFVALSMLAEITGGESRQQILDALNIPDLDTLRTQVEALWEDSYFRHEDGYEICTLANSLWLDKGLDYNQETMDNLAYYHYASVFQTDLQEETAGKALRAWLNNNTGGLLEDYTKTAGFSPESVLTLASTIYLQSKWVDEFNSGMNTEGIFHSPDEDQNVTFMNKKLAQMYYHWRDSFGAVALPLENGTRMWFFLPDEDKTVDDILREGQYLACISEEYNRDGENKKYMMVNLSVPKFDISSGGNVAGLFREMGITDVFTLGAADFTAITADTPVYLSSANQAARVIVDEQGVKAASYIELPAPGAAMPPEEIIDFILDRPFLFVIATDNGVPLFTGVVNEP